MNKFFKKAVMSYFRDQLPAEFIDFKERQISKEEKAKFDLVPIMTFVKSHGTAEYFVVFLSYKDSRLVVEVGWKHGVSFPSSTTELLHIDIRTLYDTFDWPRDDFAVTLVLLCPDRRPAIVPWNLYDQEVWDRNRETYRDFKRRQDHFQNISIALAWAKKGGITEEYANNQAALIGGDIMLCLREHGIPFLEEAMRRHSLNTPIEHGKRR